MGCVGYELLKLDLPFKARSFHQLLHSITKKEPDPIPELYSTSLRKLVKSMLQKPPLKRPSVKTILHSIHANWPLYKEGTEIYSQEEKQNNYNHNTSREVIPKHRNNHPDLKHIFPRSWKEAMDKAEKNVVDGDFQTTHALPDLSLCTVPSLQCSSNSMESETPTIRNKQTPDKRSQKETFEKEGINTLVRRLEKMNKDFSDFSKVSSAEQA